MSLIVESRTSDLNLFQAEISFTIQNKSDTYNEFFIEYTVRAMTSRCQCANLPQMFSINFCVASRPDGWSGKEGRRGRRGGGREGWRGWVMEGRERGVLCYGVGRTKIKLCQEIRLPRCLISQKMSLSALL